MVETLREVVTAGRARLADAGIADPLGEARRVCAAICGVDALMAGPGPLAETDAERVERALERRAGGEPFAYVVGRAGFRELDLLVDRRVLIPRPETEGLVERVTARVPEGLVADIGTGSGCIALSLATEPGRRRVIATDRSRDALAVAAANVAALAAPVALVLGDLLSPLGDGSLDAIVSNPPYLSAAEYRTLDPAVHDWEPRPALESGADGLDATRRLLADGLRVVRPGGWIMLELDCRRASETARYAVECGWVDVDVQADLFGRERYLLARRSATT